MSSQLQASQEQLLSACMIKDRFRLGKAMQGRKVAGGLQKQVQRSIAEAESRAGKLPRPQYPAQLPVSQRVEDIKKAISKNQVVIIAGETGSGKTTQIPKICLELGRGVFGIIGHTQPRRVAARTVAHRIAEELNVKFGEQVGYQVRFTDQTSPDTHIKVMTDGILLAETQQDRFLEKYDTIIIDEAHERSLNIDFLLGYLKRILPRRPDLKLIITSATIDVERFSRHFSNAPVVEVSGRTFPVEVHYRPMEDSRSEDTDQLMYQSILDTLHEIQQMEKQQKSSGDVLVFLAGEREIRELAVLIRKANFNNLEVLPLYSRLSVAEQNRVFQKHQQRRVVLATNVAETSLPGIRYVIDPGFARISRYRVRSKVQQLPIEAISQASANQRKGRCGRVSEGVCFRLYSEDDFISRPEFTAPEILRTNLAAVILQMLTLRLGEVEKFPFIEKPEQRQINDGYQLLIELQAVDAKKKITRLGKEMARLPVDLRLGRMLLEAARRGCLSEVLTIVSALAIQDPRERPHEHQQAADTKHRQHWDEQSDFSALLNLWETLQKERQNLTNNQFRRYCRDNFISYMRFIEWRENHRQLQLTCKDLQLKFNNNAADYEAIHIALLSGLLGNIGEKHDDNEYLGARNRRHHIFPGSSQFKRKPRWIVSAELVETSRLFGRMVAQIESHWIEPLAQHLVKRTYHEPFFDPKRGQVLAFEEVMLYGLVIVKRRKVDYGAVEPATARHLLIQSGLVEQQLQSKAGFYRHNCQLVDEIEKLESKSRKRDILVDSYTVYRFYDERLPENIVSAYDLEQWRKTFEVKQPKLLYLEKDTLMKQVPALSEKLYPNQIQVADTVLNLDYHFDPQHEHDGVSLNVPLAMLRQVPDAQLDWVIPGLLEEKCLALIKSLPKAIRKNFVPAPDYAKRAVDGLDYDGRTLTEALAERLFRQTGVRVSPENFDTTSIDQHLRMNIKLLDDKGRVVASGRNLAEMREAHDADAKAGFDKRDQHQLEQSGIVDWRFGELPEVIQLKQAGVKLKGYPAIVDHGEDVSIEIKDNPRLAKQLTQQGLLRLFMLQLKDQKKYLEKNIPDFGKISLYYATRGLKADLQADLVDCIFRYTFLEGKPVVNTKALFTARLEERQNLMHTANQVAALLVDVLKRALAIDETLKSKTKQRHPAVYKDIVEQMDLLIGPGFLRSVPLAWLKQYPRYFKAIEYRLEKMQGNQDRDTESTKVVQGFCQRLDDMRSYSPDVEKYRWMIEELRVSLFAQPLGTHVPISAKRLEKEWQEVVKRGSN